MRHLMFLMLMVLPIVICTFSARSTVNILLLFLARLFALRAKKSAQKLNETWDKLEASTFASPDSPFLFRFTLRRHATPPSSRVGKPKEALTTQEKFS
ncbi:GD16961 [Drosophila simulans]|uniref:GD16961 n=1 Tax=Drosophila simulans TaxID=7240 RepID=B4R758_DROSI|nr:GD16961 [Drosophila simulans]